MDQYKPGETIAGEYEVQAVFGGKDQSGMRVVYLVRHREYPRPIVLKTLQDSTDSEAHRLFLDEALAWVGIGAHENIVQAYWVRELDGQELVAAEYIRPDEDERNSLTHFIEAGPLPLELSLLWATHFCRGMAYARTKGLLAHRDIKPDNLMVDEGVRLKVTDFGLAKSLDLRGAVLGPMPGSVVGTLPYMSPEQFTAAGAVDHRADIYAFGIVLYQMAAGGTRYPYQITGSGPDLALEFCRAHVRQEPLALNSPLMPIIARCLRKEAQDRYDTYEELLGDLSGVAARLKVRLPAEVHVQKDDEEIYARAQSYVALGDSDRALKEIDSYVAKYPSNPCGWTEKGRIHFERKEYANAVTATKRALEEHPYNTHAWNNLGLSLLHSEASMAEIRAAFGRALVLDPQNTAAMVNLVGPLAESHEYGDAAAVSARALRTRPKKATAWRQAESLLARILEAGDLKAAETLLSAWTELRPDDVNGWHNRAIVAKSGGESDRAIKYFRMVLQLAPTENFALVQLAKLYFERKKSRDCLDCCNQLLQRRHEVLLAVSLKARLLNYMASLPDALAFLEPYLRHNPSEDALWVLLAEIYEYRDQNEDAVHALKRARDLLRRRGREGDVENLLFLERKIAQLGARS